MQDAAKEWIVVPHNKAHLDTIRCRCGRDDCAGNVAGGVVILTCATCGSAVTTLAYSRGLLICRCAHCGQIQLPIAVSANVQREVDLTPILDLAYEPEADEDEDEDEEDDDFDDEFDGLFGN